MVFALNGDPRCFVAMLSRTPSEKARKECERRGIRKTPIVSLDSRIYALTNFRITATTPGGCGAEVHMRTAMLGSVRKVQGSVKKIP